jgi:hypothetical protein
MLGKLWSGLLFFFLIALLAVSSSADPKFGKITDEDLAAAAPVDLPEANAVILFEWGEMNVTDDYIDYYRHVRIKVLTAAGVEEVGDQSFSYQDDGEKIKDFKAQTITPDGTRHEVADDAVFEKSIGVWRTRTFAFPALEPGAIAEFKYRRRIDTQRSWQAYLPPWFFQNQLYTYRSEFAVVLQSGFGYEVIYQNIPGPQQEPEVTEMPDPQFNGQRFKKKFRWLLEKLLPVNDEPYMSSANDYRSAVRFQLTGYANANYSINFLKPWSELGDNFQTSLNVYCNCRGEVEKLARQITEGIIDPREQSKALFAYVAGTIALSEDYTSRYFVHDKMSKVLEQKLASGEGKNLLLVELHKAIGLESWPVLISSRSNARFNPQIPNLWQFDYLIAFVQLGEQWEFLDAVSRYSPYGLLPPNCLTEGGFLIDGGKSELVRMTIKPVASYRVDHTRIFVGAGGAVTCSTEARFSGYYSSLYADRYGNHTPKEFIDSYFLKQLELPVEGETYSCDVDSTDQFVAKLAFTSPEMAVLLDNNLLLTPAAFAFRDNPFENERRYFPVDFQYPFSFKNIVEIIPDSPVAEVQLPEDIERDIGGLTFTRHGLRDGTSIMVVSELTVTEPKFSPHRYERVRDLFQNIAAAFQDEIVIVPASDR